MRSNPQIVASLCILILTGCSGATGGQKPKFVNKSEREVSISHSGWIAPRPMAESHCQQFGKTAVYKGFIRIREGSDRKIHYYDCRYPVAE